MIEHVAYSKPVLRDQFARVKRKLRISVTDRCNFKCVYCMPEHPKWLAKHDLLSFEALFVFCQLMVQQGIEHIRITGGEPLMRQGIVHFIRDLQVLRGHGLKRISMTSNGHYLAQHAAALKTAGLDDINISLDSIDPMQFATLTQKSLKPVLVGIAAAQSQGFPLKINCVLMRGYNEQQILPLIDWATAQGLCLRFIEFMPLDGDAHWQHSQVVTEAEILATVRAKFQVQLLAQGSEPARMYSIHNAHVQAQFGIISTISHSFCGDCDRIRLSATGELFNCLFATKGLKLNAALNQLLHSTSHMTDSILESNSQDSVLTRADDAMMALQTQIQNYIWHKAAGYSALQDTRAANNSRKISMHMLGG